MAARKTAPAKKPAAKRAAPPPAALTAKKVTKAPSKRPAVAGAKPTRKRVAKPAPPIVIPAPIGVLPAVEAFIASAEVTGQGRVKAEIARKLARALDSAEPASAPALARELQAALVGILPRDSEEHEDWTTRLGAAADRDAKGS